jgi:hypothetical protein
MRQGRHLPAAEHAAGAGLPQIVGSGPIRISWGKNAGRVGGGGGHAADAVLMPVCADGLRHLPFCKPHSAWVGACTPGGHRHRRRQPRRLRGTSPSPLPVADTHAPPMPAPHRRRAQGRLGLRLRRLSCVPRLRPSSSSSSSLPRLRRSSSRRGPVRGLRRRVRRASGCCRGGCLPELLDSCGRVRLCGGRCAGGPGRCCCCCCRVGAGSSIRPAAAAGRGQAQRGVHAPAHARADRLLPARARRRLSGAGAAHRAGQWGNGVHSWWLSQAVSVGGMYVCNLTGVCAFHRPGCCPASEREVPASSTRCESTETCPQAASAAAPAGAAVDIMPIQPRRTVDPLWYVLPWQASRGIIAAS